MKTPMNCENLANSVKTKAFSKKIITYIPLLRTLITYLPNLKFKLHISPSYSKMTHIPLQHKRIIPHTNTAGLRM
ncbi:hypothetical protein Hanom_Chr03g00181071 [Helianthus anomalus]